MITQEGLKQYRQFEIDFRETCKRICKLLVRYNKKYDCCWDEFELFDEEKEPRFVECRYYTYCCGERDTDYETFPMDLLFMKDEEINKWIDNKLEEERKKAEEEKRKNELKAKKNAERNAAKKREHDLAEYERIKKEYNL